ncbi:UBC-like protein [Neoconidiobolus thromboides FSU 785]|nr:UBC-like protein [Neoconidiobolus thromboides FSU 785]
MEYNKKSPAVKRIMKEYKDIMKNPSSYFIAKPLEENIFDWHFTIFGPNNTEYEGGRYHGRIILPNEYPFKPPHLMFLTPNGRFELRTKICLNITGYHPESWQPAWSISTLLLGVISLFPIPLEGVGALTTSVEARKNLAKNSLTWKCDICNEKMSKIIIKDDSNESLNKNLSNTDREFLNSITLTYESDKKDKDENSSEIQGNNNNNNMIELNTSIEEGSNNIGIDPIRRFIRDKRRYKRRRKHGERYKQ